MCVNLVHTAIEQTQKRGVALSAHGGTYTPSSSLDLAFALFMIVRNARPRAHEDFFGWSSGDYWLTRDWSWNETAPLYTHPWGEARGPPLFLGEGRFGREYDGGTFRVDCVRLRANITLR